MYTLGSWKVENYWKLELAILANIKDFNLANILQDKDNNIPGVKFKCVCPNHIDSICKGPAWREQHRRLSRGCVPSSPPPRSPLHRPLLRFIAGSSQGPGIVLR